MSSRDLKTEMLDRGLGPFGPNDTPDPDLSVRALNEIWNHASPVALVEQLDEVKSDAESDREEIASLKEDLEARGELLRRAAVFLASMQDAESLLDEINETV